MKSAATSSNFVNRARTRLRLTRRQLAEQLGLSPQKLRQFQRDAPLVIRLAVGQLELTAKLAVIDTKIDELWRLLREAPIDPRKSDLLTLEEAESALKIGRAKIYQLADQGRLSVIRIGQRVLVTQESIDRLVAELKDAPWRSAKATEPQS